LPRVAVAKRCKHRERHKRACRRRRRYRRRSHRRQRRRPCRRIDLRPTGLSWNHFASVSSERRLGCCRKRVRRYLRWHSRHDSCATAGDDDGYDDEKVTVLVRMQFVISPDIQQKVPRWLLRQSDAVVRYSMR